MSSRRLTMWVRNRRLFCWFTAPTIMSCPLPNRKDFVTSCAWQVWPVSFIQSQAAVTASGRGNPYGSPSTNQPWFSGSNKFSRRGDRFRDRKQMVEISDLVLGRRESDPRVNSDRSSNPDRRINGRAKRLLTMAWCGTLSAFINN